MNEFNAPQNILDLKRNAVVVIPCYNAGPRVQKTVKDTLDFVERIVLVDDGSTDGCTEGLESFPILKTVLPQNQGKGNALISGIRQSLSLPEVSIIILMDADGQHDPAELPGLLYTFQSMEADLVIGARTLNKVQTPWRSRIGNQMTARVAARMFHCPLTDTQCGYRLLSPRFAEDFISNIPGGRYETEMRMILFAINRGYKMVSSPIMTIYEPGNRSSHFRKVRDSLRIYWTLWQSFAGRNRTLPY
jgi:glycosyltransferase involved in cell wall biosynthesis